MCALFNFSITSNTAPMGSVLDRTLIQSADGVKGGAARLVLRSAILGSALPVLEENGRSRLPSITEALRCIPDTRRGSNPCSHKFVGRRKKTGGIFNWFCPHGFGYGTSIITNAEGRKDAMLSLYTHCETAPKVVVYDFACQLEEYCRNRVPAFFAETRYANTRASLIIFVMCLLLVFFQFFY